MTGRIAYLRTCAFYAVLILTDRLFERLQAQPEPLPGERTAGTPRRTPQAARTAANRFARHLRAAAPQNGAQGGMLP